MGLIRGQYIYICTMYIPLINMCVYIYTHEKHGINYLHVFSNDFKSE